MGNSQAQPQSSKTDETPQTTKEVTIRVLNKITGQTTTLKTTLLKPIKHGNLIIRPRECFKKKVGLAYEINWSFIEAWVQQTRYQPVLASTVPQVPQQPVISLVFSSWINSASPSFSHPDYSVTIQDCQEVAVIPLRPSAESSPDHPKNAK